MTDAASITPAVSRRRVADRLAAPTPGAIVDVSDLTIDWVLMTKEIEGAGLEIDRPVPPRGSTPRAV